MAPSSTFQLSCEYFVFDDRKECMASLLNALDLAGVTRCHGLETRRDKFGFQMSRILEKPVGSSDDELFARNLWPCCDLQCNGVLSPLDSTDPEVGTISEMSAEYKRGCPICGKITLPNKLPFLQKLHEAGNAARRRQER